MNMFKRILKSSLLIIAIALSGSVMSGTTNKTYDGYNLVAPNFHTTTYLVDMDGNVVHYWLNDGSPAISAYLLENGNLLRTSTVDQLEQPATGQNAPRGRGGFGGMGGGAMPGFGSESRGGGAGGRIQEIDWDGKVVWEFKFVNDDHITHHDIELLPNGNILCIAWERKTAQETIDAGRNPSVQGNNVLHPDFIIEVKPDKVNNGGEIVWQWHAWDHLIQDFDKNKTNYGDVASHPELIDINFTANRTVTQASGSAQPAMGGFGGGMMGGFGGGGGMTMMGLTGAGGTMPPDWMHTNAVDYNPDLDQIAISCYGFSEIWVIDHSTTTEQAKGHTGGKYGRGGDLIYRWGNPRAYRAGTEEDQKFFNQHDVHWITKGRPGAEHLLVFNNGPYRADGDYSSVDEIVTPVDENGNYPLEKGTSYGPKEAVWSYTAPKKTDFFSMHISGAERQPNGNTLICSGAYGVFFEVTPEKEVIWRCVYTGGDGPKGPDTKSQFGGGMMGGMMGGGFGGRGGGGFGGFPGMTGFGGQQSTPAEKLPRFVVSRDDPTVAGLKGMPQNMPVWGGGTGFGIMETQTFRVYRYTADYPGLKGKELKPIDLESN